MSAIANYYGFGLEAWSQLTNEQQTAITFAYGQLSRAGLESTGFRVAGPVWQPGDVLLIRYHDRRNSTRVVVRDHEGTWRGGRTVVYDSRATDLRNSGEATLILRDGQLTDDGARMAGERLERWIAEGGERGRYSFYSDAEHEAYLSGIVYARSALRSFASTSEAGE